jgi:hypothetical protein
MMAFECFWLGDTKKKITKKKAAWSATGDGGIAPVVGA